MPSKLGKAGRKLWRDLAVAYEFELRELALLEACARQADDLELVERELRERGLMIVGSKGQPRMSPLISEARQARLALARLLGELALPAEDADDAPTTLSSARARRAADVRWAKTADRRATIAERKATRRGP